MFASVIRKPVLIAALFIAAAAFAACGDLSDDYNQSNKVGPDGPTIPGGYYMDLTLSPSVVQWGENSPTITVTAHVWDANGVGVPNVKVYYSGDLDVENAGFTTDSNGYSSIPAVIKGVITEGIRKYITATVEDVSLTVSYRLIPQGGI